jgi:hypothetical protein
VSYFTVGWYISPENRSVASASLNGTIRLKATGLDPVAAGLVSSTNRPGGNITGGLNPGVWAQSHQGQPRRRISAVWPRAGRADGRNGHRTILGGRGRGGRAALERVGPGTDLLNSVSRAIRRALAHQNGSPASLRRRRAFNRDPPAQHRIASVEIVRHDEPSA